MAEPDDDLPIDPDEPVEIEIGDALDLHTFAPRDVAAVVAAYLDAAVERGLPEVRLIHGKGRGVQRASVRRILERHPRVREFFDGTPERGAWGATIVRLDVP
jgi:dsDNA-specific endonuclease/ATPase MutS2